MSEKAEMMVVDEDHVSRLDGWPWADLYIEHGKALLRASLNWCHVKDSHEAVGELPRPYLRGSWLAPRAGSRGDPTRRDGGHMVDPCGQKHKLVSWCGSESRAADCKKAVCVVPSFS